MTRRQTATVLFIVLCVVLVAAAVSLNVGWIMTTGREVFPLVLGVVAFALIIAGIIVYTVFLVRELRRTEQQDSFLNAVTHELKTPIASIRLYLETLQARELSDAQRREFYQVMLDDTARLQYTVEQVLRAGVASQRRRLAHRAPVDLGALAVECIETVRRRHHLPAEAVALAGTAPDAMIVDGDVDELRTAIGNLLDNAVKYSGSTVKVNVELEHTTAAQATLRVRDQGVGIAPTELKRIFKRFYRARNIVTTRVKGTGLGLFIVRSVIARHGGKVFAESPGLGQGATFTVQLPASPAS